MNNQRVSLVRRRLDQKDDRAALKEREVRIIESLLGGKTIWCRDSENRDDVDRQVRRLVRRDSFERLGHLWIRHGVCRRQAQISTAAAMRLVEVGRFGRRV